MSETREKKTITIGYSFQDSCVQIGYDTPDMEEALLLTQVSDSGKTNIPLCVCKLENSSQWVFGEEACSAQREKRGTMVENLSALCEKGEPVVVDDVPYMPEELLGIFIRRSLSLLHRIGNLDQIRAMTFTFPTLSMKLLKTMRGIFKELPIDNDRLFLMDEKESFYHFVMHQKTELRNNDVMLFDARMGRLKVWTLTRVRATQVQPYAVTEERFPRFSFGGKDARTDAQFAAFLEQLIGKRLVSCVFLTGREFEGGWMKESAKVLCRGRKVFFVDQIAVRGACLRGLRSDERDLAPRQFYMGEHQLKGHLGLYVWNGREQQYCRLIWAGTSWYEASASHTFLVDRCDEICLQMDFIAEEKKSIRKSISLAWLPKRPNLATKIRLDVSYESADSCLITVTDLGLGELFLASGKSVTERMGG